MFRNYFKTAFRSLSANKVYSIITVAGLGVGIAVCLVIFVFIRYEQSFDTFHPNGPRIYRVLTKRDVSNPADYPFTSGVPFPLPTVIEHDLPDWKTTGIFDLGDIQIMALNKAGLPEKKFKEKGGVFMVQASFFSMFHFPWLAGDSSKLVGDHRSVILTQSTAEKYFGDWKQAVGRTIKYEDHDLFVVTGILADPPANTDFQFKIIFPYGNRTYFTTSTDWWSIDGSHGCYVILPPDVTVASANRQLGALSKKYRTPDNKNTQVLQSLAEVHFDPKAGDFSGKTITWDLISGLWLIAGFILLIACVNFINISTAQAVNRAREVGVRKVLGSSRRQLTFQFMLEALLLVVAAVVLAVVLTSLLLAPIAGILKVPISFDLFSQPPVMLFLAAMTITVTLLAGCYPALVLSSFNPITALKSKLSARSSSGITLRRGLVVLQFVIAQALIIGTLLVLRQMNYFNNAPMGFDKQAIIRVPFPQDSVSLTKLDYLRNRLLAMKGVQKVSYNNATPAEFGSWWSTFKFDHAAKGTPFAVVQKRVDANYLGTYSLPLVAGRNITSTDSIKEFLINETLARRLGFSNPHDIINKEINFGGGSFVGPIAGVVKDFHGFSMKDSLAPMLMFNDRRSFDEAAIKLDGNNVPATLHSIESLWNETYPDYVFEYEFMDEKVASFYADESRLSQIYKIFSSIAIFLSCLGLYGLASFMAVQRIKEVGIRKVLGATAANIVYLFSREFVVLIGVAFVISAPITWYFVDQWLQQYVFRLPISGWIFGVGGLLAALIAMATVGWQAFRAASVNPVKNLRAE
jgi:putative ABC transport system permease protein